jgi:phosphatidylserine/phosphatidylglycerophosphate/cardiolipin synthase-like enzyme
MKNILRRIMPLLSLALLFTTSASAFEQAQGIRSHAVAVSGTVQVLFTPEDDAAGQIVLAIAHAQKQVLVQTFSFTNREIAQALISAKQRGVDVRVVTDAEQIQRMERSKVPMVAAGGVPVFVDSLHASAHNKVMVIDAGSASPVVITGSFNFTHAAQFKNAENLLIFRGNRELTAAYLENWRRHREHSQPLAK